MQIDLIGLHIVQTMYTEIYPVQFAVIKKNLFLISETCAGWIIKCILVFKCGLTDQYYFVAAIFRILYSHLHAAYKYKISQSLQPLSHMP